MTSDSSDTLSPPPVASAPLADWISWAVKELRFEVALNVILREPDVASFSGVGRTTRQEMIEAGEFPAPFALNDSGRARGWDAIELFAWKCMRLARRDELRGAEGRDLIEAIKSLRRTRRKA
jgi:predicted DNA-binding transcriptional regulator AlpA